MSDSKKKCASWPLPSLFLRISVVLGASLSVNIASVQAESFGIREESSFAIAGSRELQINDVMSRVLSGEATPVERYQLEVNLRLADDATLDQLSTAVTFEEVSNILLFGSSEETNLQSFKFDRSIASGATSQAIGSTTEDFVYTSVPPCRIADTRVAGGMMLGGTTRSFYVYGGNDPIRTAQGGKEGGCSSPKGEPRAVHINVTVVGRASGHLTVYPANLVNVPLASIINFKNGTVVANAAVVESFYGSLSNPELSVFAAGNVDVIIDVLGYFHEVDSIDPNLLTTITTFGFTNSAPGVTGAECPNNSSVISANCHCDNVDGTRNFGVLFLCNIAGNGALAGCFPEASTFNPLLPEPLATVITICAQRVSLASASAFKAELSTDSTLTQKTDSVSVAPGVDTDPEFARALDTYRLKLQQYRESMSGDN